MGFIRKRANGALAYVFMWKGKRHTKNLGTDNEQEANQIKKDADDQLARIRNGQSALASRLLADGHSILDVLFGSDEIAHLIPDTPDDNPLTLSQLRDAFMDHLRDGGRTPGHIEGTKTHMDQFISVLGNRRVASLTDADMADFKRKREKKVTPDTIRANFKSLNSAINWAIKRKPPLLKTCPFSIPSVSGTGRKPFLPTEEIERLLADLSDEEKKDLIARWVLDLDEINKLIKLAEKKMPEMALPLKLICSTGMRRIQLVRLRPGDLVDGTLTIISKKGARQKGLAEIHQTVQLRDSVAKELRTHLKSLPKRSKVMFPVFEAFDYSGINKRWKGKSTRTPEQRRCDRADRLFEKLVKGTDFERLDGYHALRHSFISILVSQGKTWDQIAAFVGHLDKRTTQRYIHFMPKDKRATVESVPFEF